MAKTSQSAEQGEAGSKDRFWNPRFWSGMCLSAWAPLLVRNRFAVSISCVGMVFLLGLCAVCHSAAWLVQTLLLGRKIAAVRIEKAPIFIVGHWRSGTTLLHELMVLDPRHTYPDTFECFVPNHFLLSGRLLRWPLSFILPKRRPTDNMSAGWDRPQEDEFALCNMGVPSPYLTITFPNRPPQCQEYFDLEKVSSKEREHWKRSFLWFLQCVTLRKPRRLVLKSPPHTARIKILLELFPDARFIHIVRDPYVVFPSTVKLWQRLYQDQGFQRPNYNGLDEHVLDTLCRMYNTFERDRKLLDPSRLCDVRYEDLTKDPIGQMRRVYEQLELDGFEQAVPALEEYVAAKKGYKKNRYEISEETRAEITSRWSGYIERYGYTSEAT